MKKIFVLLIIAMLFAPVAAMAAVAVFNAEPVVAPDGQSISVLSNKVSLIASSNNLMYAAATGHEAGDKVYGGTSGDTKIYSKAASDPLNLANDSGVTDSDTAQFAGSWKPL